MNSLEIFHQLLQGSRARQLVELLTMVVVPIKVIPPEPQVANPPIFFGFPHHWFFGAGAWSTTVISQGKSRQKWWVFHVYVKLLDGKEMVSDTVTQAKHDPGSTSQSAHVLSRKMMVIITMIRRMSLSVIIIMKIPLINDPPNHDD